MTTGKILIVDDDRPVLHTLKLLLESAVYEVTDTEREEEALRIVHAEAFDLAIIDLRLRLLDGISLMKEIKTGFPALLVIILTGAGTIDTAVEAMRHGAAWYLTKPCNSTDLFLKMRELEDKCESDSQQHSGINNLNKRSPKRINNMRWQFTAKSGKNRL